MQSGNGCIRDREYILIIEVSMEQYVIKGGNPLVGEVEIGGAKNAALGILAAAIMTDETVVIDNLPDVQDINVLLEAISVIGARVDRISRHKVAINGSMIGQVSVDYEFIKKIRASYYLLGALLGKYKHAEVPLPGGCNIASERIQSTGSDNEHPQRFHRCRGRKAERNTYLFRYGFRRCDDQHHDGSIYGRGIHDHREFST